MIENILLSYFWTTISKRLLIHSEVYDPNMNINKLRKMKKARNEIEGMID